MFRYTCVSITTSRLQLVVFRDDSQRPFGLSQPHSHLVARRDGRHSCRRRGRRGVRPQHIFCVHRVSKNKSNEK